MLFIIYVLHVLPRHRRIIPVGTHSLFLPWVALQKIWCKGNAVSHALVSIRLPYKSDN